LIDQTLDLLFPYPNSAAHADAAEAASLDVSADGHLVNAEALSYLRNGQ
jgi:hypothetical protein